MNTTDYLDRPPRELSQVMAARERREAYREFLEGPYREAKKALQTIRDATDELPKAQEMILAMCADIESDFNARLNELEDRMRA
jgi:hypothetical protein